MIECIYRMVKRKVVVRDNYFVMRSVVRNRGSSSCIEVWQGNGGLKKLGVEDASNHHGSSGDLEGFK
ncbi:CDP-glycerol glycerophosphotransferase family protein, partial [Bacillus altitudinis]|uniref:CDP-glycerol glycerophosphotransferase family protein n=1 Tax=Bacillus altitudinis TaxID=293387 RepID=UPI003B52B0C7